MVSPSCAKTMEEDEVHPTNVDRVLRRFWPKRLVGVVVLYSLRIAVSTGGCGSSRPAAVVEVQFVVGISLFCPPSSWETIREERFTATPVVLGLFLVFLFSLSIGSERSAINWSVENWGSG
jgi:hypothetical protein